MHYKCPIEFGIKIRAAAAKSNAIVILTGVIPTPRTCFHWVCGLERDNDAYSGGKIRECNLIGQF